MTVKEESKPTPPATQTLPGSVPPTDKRVDQVVEKLNISFKEIERALASKPEQELEKLEKQIALFDALLNEASRNLSRLQQLKVKDPKIQRMADQISDYTTQLKEKISDSKKQIVMNRKTERALAREELRPVIQKIITSITTAPRWSDEAVSIITSTLTSLVDGDETQVISHVVVPEVLKNLQDFLRNTEALRSSSEVERKKLRLDKDFDVKFAKELRDELQEYRAHYLGVEDEPEEKDVAIDRGPEVQVQQLQPEPQSLPKTIVRKK